MNRRVYRVTRAGQYEGSAVLLEAEYLEVSEQGSLGLYNYLPNAEVHLAVTGNIGLELVWIFASGYWSDVRPATEDEQEAWAERPK